MTGTGRLVECTEDMEIENLDINFYDGIYYTALLEEDIYVIDRSHKSIKLTTDQFKRHFKLIING